ncbi:restriction endonuclease [Oscillatoria laete-virens NRMC-F 0139]|nr:restriction endonuclease [Oscillatoria laete-virens]MDL5055260.1 restriction endonuclease [Oscillatoria laete-virens NRMC-F 0139]
MGIVAFVILLGMSGFHDVLISFLWIGLLVAFLGILALTIWMILRKRKHELPPSSPSQNSTIIYPATKGKPAPNSQSVTDLKKAIHTIDWFQFEKLISLLLESEGYKIISRGGANPDGGIDMIAEYDGQRAAIQCKQWKSQIPVKVVREMMGSMLAEEISTGVIVALNGYSPDAQELAKKHGIYLYSEEDILHSIQELNPQKRSQLDSLLDDPTKHCPKCGNVMVLRTGKNNTKFWGCSKYPRCHQTLRI